MRLKSHPSGILHFKVKFVLVHQKNDRGKNVMKLFAKSAKIAEINIYYLRNSIQYFQIHHLNNIR